MCGFWVKIIQLLEYIVAFKKYYKATARKNFISAALRDTQSEWEILPRNNPASDFPSDFDVVLVRLNISILNKSTNNH
jgi:hypothetical protein